MNNKLINIKATSYNMILLCFSCLLVVIACKKDEKPEVPPEITNLSISKDTIRQGYGNEDFFTFKFSFFNQYGEPGFDNDADSILLNLYDLRFLDPVPYLFIISPSDNNSYIDISYENIEVQVPTTCCAFAPDGSLPCSSVPNYYESVSYEVEYLNNFGHDIPKDTFSFVVNCAF